MRVIAVSAFVSGAPAGALSDTPSESSLHVMRGIGALTGMMGSCPMIGGMSAYADGRIAFLKSELGITAAQEAVWNTYAAALRTHLDRMLASQGDVMAVLEARTPVDRIRATIKAVESRIGSLKELEGPLAALYAALSPEQQARSDAILTGLGCTM